MHAVFTSAGYVANTGLWKVLLQLFDAPGRPHTEVQSKLLCEPYSITTIYAQSIIGMSISVLKCSHHYLSCRWNKILHALAVRIRKPHIILAIASNA